MKKEVKNKEDNITEKLRQTQIEILDYIDDFCNKHDIKYYIMFGSLLGAVRHKGFIPWDDDIDIAMDPVNYYRFKELMKTEKNDKYFYQSVETDKYYNLKFAKIRKNNTLAVESRNQDQKFHQGIWVDIFPMMPLPNDESDKKKMMNNIKMINLMLEADLNDKTKYNKYGRVGKVLSKIFRYIPRSIRNKIISKKFKKICFYEGEYDKYFCDTDSTFVSYFKKTTKVSFEGKKYSAPADYDKVLTDLYGDYMTPPKEKDRKGHSVIKIDFDTTKGDNNGK